MTSDPLTDHPARLRELADSIGHWQPNTPSGKARHGIREAADAMAILAAENARFKDGRAPQWFAEGYEQTITLERARADRAEADLAKAQKENLEISDDYAGMVARRDEALAKLAREERTSQRLTRMLQAVVERNKKLEAVAEAATHLPKEGPAHPLLVSGVLAALAALEEKPK